MPRRGTTLPKQIIPIETGLKLFCQWKEAPCPQLAGLSPISLFKGPFIDIDRVWFIGSCAWMPLVTGKKFDDKTDIDICFADKDQALAFRDHAVEALTSASAVLRVVEGLECNRFGGPKLFWTKPRKKPHAPEEIEEREFMDIMWPPPGRTIAEVISGFLDAHEKVSVTASAQPGDINAVVRLTYEWVHNIHNADHRKECHACNVGHAQSVRYNDGS